MNQLAPFEIIEMLKSGGVDLSHVALGHIERTHCKIARCGCYLQYDMFGWEGYHKWLYPKDLPNDAERIACIAKLVAEGYTKHILLSHDISFKTRLVHYGGHGYAHILRNITGRMRDNGISDEDVHTILVENPKSLLQFREPNM